MFKTVLTIEKPTDDDGLILEEVTKRDIIEAFNKLHNVWLNEADITFQAAGYYGEDEAPIELGLFQVRIAGLTELVKYWIVPLPEVKLPPKVYPYNAPKVYPYNAVTGDFAIAILKAEQQKNWARR